MGGAKGQPFARVRAFWKRRIRPGWNVVFSEGSVDNWSWSRFDMSGLFERLEGFGWLMFFGGPIAVIGSYSDSFDATRQDRVMLVLATLVGLALIRVSRKKPTEEQRVAMERHSVKVFRYVGPPAPYVIAICECGWMGEFHDELDPAFTEAREHSVNVEPEVDEVA